MLNKKYEFTGEKINHYGCTLRRIRRLSDGLIGGYIESEVNLSHNGMCFVYDQAKIFDEAKIIGNVRVDQDAEVYCHATLSGDMHVTNNAVISCFILIHGKGQIISDNRYKGCNSSEPPQN